MVDDEVPRAGGSCLRNVAGDAGIAVACLLVYLLCGHCTLHGTDSENLVLWLKADDRLAYPRHVAFLPLTCSLHTLLQPLGVSAFRTLLLASAFGAAFGVFAIARTARLLLPTGSSPRLAALAVATTPAWAFYATAVELHGVYAAGLGAAWWMYARWSVRPVAARAIGLGLVAGAAGALHGLGTILMPMFVLFAVSRRALSWRPGLVQATLAIGAQLAAMLLLSWLWSPAVDGQAERAVAWLSVWLGMFELRHVPLVLWREWLWPYLPWFAIAVVGLRDVVSKQWARCWWIAIALHGPVALLLLARPQQIDEHGAYLLPVAVPAALASAAMLRGGWSWLMLVVSVVLAVLHIAPEWRRSYPEGYVAGIAELRRERPFTLVVGRFDEIEAVAIETDAQPLLDVNRALSEILGQRSAGTGAPLSVWFDGAVALFAAGGSPLFVTEGGRAALVGSFDDEVRRLWGEHIEANYQLLPEVRAGLRGWFLRPR